MNPRESRELSPPGAEAGSLSNQVFEQLEQGILDGSIPPGESLVELKLSAELGVSRTPVREAIRMLEQKGLVRLTPNKGAVVLGVDSEDLLDVYVIRSYIEGLASRRAAEKITPERSLILREIVDLQEFYCLKSYQERSGEMDSRFHETIYAFCESRTLQHMLKDLHHMIRRFRSQSLAEAGRLERAVAEHRRILDAIAKGDGDEAERLTVIHIGNARENLLRLLEKKVEG